MKIRSVVLRTPDCVNAGNQNTTILGFTDTCSPDTFTTINDEEMRSEMRDKTIALNIEIKELANSEKLFHFSDTMLLAIYEWLRNSYKEVFIWTFRNYVSVWAVGNDRLALINAFIRHHNHYERMKVFEEDAALENFRNIMAGNCWEDCSLTERAISLSNAYSIAKEQGSLGSVMLPLIEECLIALRDNSVISGSRNSWTRKFEEMSDDRPDASKVEETTKDLFYRFCIN